MIIGRLIPAGTGFNNHENLGISSFALDNSYEPPEEPSSRWDNALATPVPLNDDDLIFDDQTARVYAQSDSLGIAGRRKKEWFAEGDSFSDFEDDDGDDRLDSYGDDYDDEDVPEEDE